jgi:hypothetical protein
MFSYGSGMTSTMFSFKINEGQHPFSLSNIASILDISNKLESRHIVSLSRSSPFSISIHLVELPGLLYHLSCCVDQLASLIATNLVLSHRMHLHTGPTEAVRRGAETG